jgi:hypothetical protein
MKASHLSWSGLGNTKATPLFPDHQGEDVIQGVQKPFRKIHKGDARRLLDLPDDYVDLVVTSPPYWRKRDYGFEEQIGQEKTSGEYVANIIDAMAEWRQTPQGQ